jgi:hypothetical protein
MLLGSNQFPPVPFNIFAYRGVAFSAHTKKKIHPVSLIDSSTTSCF